MRIFARLLAAAMFVLVGVGVQPGVSRAAKATATKATATKATATKATATMAPGAKPKASKPKANKPKANNQKASKPKVAKPKAKPKANGRKGRKNNNRGRKNNNRKKNKAKDKDKADAKKGFTGSLADQRKELEVLHDQARMAAGLMSLEVNAQLNEAAQKYAEYLNSTGKFGHTEQGTVASRVAAAGYEAAACGENIAKGAASISATVKGWLGGGDAKRRLLAEGFRDVGYGVAGKVVVAVYARPKETSASDAGT